MAVMDQLVPELSAPTADDRFKKLCVSAKHNKTKVKKITVLI
jgi:hypothetical protein